MRHPPLTGGPSAPLTRVPYREVVPARAAATTRPSAAGAHLAAVDVVRFLTVGAVILVHATSLAVSPGSVAANAVLAVAHVTRSVFIGLSALVLTYSFDRRPLAAAPFWRRRYPLVVVPYVTWSAVYVLAGGHLGSPLHVAGRFVADLFDGGAQYHLYFILLTFQLYLVFPALMAALRRWPRALWPAVVAAGGFQLAFNAAVHYGWRPPILGVWFSHPSSWLPSYGLYVLAGIATARHLDGLGSWIGTHRRLVAWLFVLSVAGALGSYAVDLDVLGYGVLRASEVFQPTDVLVAAAALLGEYALGLWFTSRAGPTWMRRLRTSSDVSFGVYLAHPLILSAVLSLAASTGVAAWGRSWPDGVAELVVALVLVPFVYATSFLLVAMARRTLASLALTGRPLAPPAAGGASTQTGGRRGPVFRIVLVATAVLSVAALVSGCGVGSNAAAGQDGGSAQTSTTTSSSTTVTTTAPTPAQQSPLGQTGSSVHWVSKTYTITFGGYDRSYLVYRPSQIQTGPIPVLVELAGCCFKITDEAQRADFRQVASPAILVYPWNVDAHWNAGACCGSAQARDIDDVGFVAAVLSAVRSENSDASRSTAFLAGYSNGAKMATKIACDRPDLFTAVAVYGATRVSDCSRPPPASILIMAGTADPEDSISGKPVTQDGFTEPTVDQLAADYRSADGCTAVSTAAAAGSVTETVWPTCADGRRVGIALWAGETHAWPESTATTPSAQQVMWDWFARFGA